MAASLENLMSQYEHVSWEIWSFESVNKSINNTLLDFSQDSVEYGLEGFE